MSVVAIIEDRVDELIKVLDKDIEHIRDCLCRLDQLRSCIIKRDDVKLTRILTQIQAEADIYITNEQKRQSIREYLAHALDCNIDQINLSKLEAILPESIRAQIAQRKALLKTLVQQLKIEYSNTALLVSECARFNNLLLRNIFGHEHRATVTYSPDGSTKKQIGTSFVNLQY
jgi:hypothetical protein